MRELLLTFFFSGKAKKAPGTCGSLAALLVWFFVTKYFFTAEISLTNQNIFWGIFLILSFIYGVIASPNYAKQFGQIDHQSIVLDEVVGQIFALQATFLLLHENYFSQNKIIAVHLIFCFAAFRFFDIKKPSFIGYIDRNFKNGLGVMLDDLVSGAVAAVIGAIIIVVLS